MSEDEYVYDSDGQGAIQYGSDVEMQQDDGEILVENKFYEGEECRGENPQQALNLFVEVVNLAKTNQDVKWLWKGLEWVVRMKALLKKPENEITEAFSELLTYMTKVTPNEVNETINNVLDTVGDLDTMYSVALLRLKNANNERLWFSTNLRRGKAFLAKGEYDRLLNIINELKECPIAHAEGAGSYMLEIYALEIAMYGATKEKTKMKETYAKTQALSSAVQDPRIMGGIHESGGKMLLEESKWQEAYDEFFAAFRHMQEAGDSRARQNLKYVVLANMLALSNINPFDSREAKVYQNDEEIKAMLGLRTAFEQFDIRTFQQLLSDPKSGIVNDPLINRYVSALLQNIRGEVLVRLIAPYKKIRLDFLGRELLVDAAQVENLVSQLILDGKLAGRVDQLTGVLDLSGSSTSTSSKNYETLLALTQQLESVTNDLVATLIPSSSGKIMGPGMDAPPMEWDTY
jgi:COP9 signalosome complex subunit 2